VLQLEPKKKPPSPHPALHRYLCSAGWGDGGFLQCVADLFAAHILCIRAHCTHLSTQIGAHCLDSRSHALHWLTMHTDSLCARTALTALHL